MPLLPRPSLAAARPISRCHGSFRSDNPLFSSLRLADGPLTVHDLERLGDVPELIVLSACESGLSAVAPGDELMGLASAFLGLGARALIGSVVPVPDEHVRPFMVSLHRRLRAGDTVSSALAETQGAWATADDDAAIAALAFICLGAG